MLALERFRIIDMTQALAGPYCTMMLADMGAEVIRVDAPDGVARKMGPQLKGDDGASFIAVNRNKKSVALDLRDLRDRAAFHELVRTADVFVENNRVGVAAKLGADWDTLSTLNERLVYASISGFGQTGPYSERPGYDLIAQGMSGIMSVTGHPQSPPTKCGLPISDLGAALFCASGILTALLAREVTGRGQRVETSLLEAAVAMSVWESSQLWDEGVTPQPMGSAHRVLAPYQALRASDGYFNVGANNDKFWSALCRALGLDRLIIDHRFVDNAMRMRNVSALVEELETVTCQRTVEDTVSALLAAGVPAGPIYDYRQSLSDPHLIERGMVGQLEHPVEGVMTVLGLPVKLSDTPGALRMPAPLLGEHNSEFLNDLAVSTVKSSSRSGTSGSTS